MSTITYSNAIIMDLDVIHNVGVDNNGKWYVCTGDRNSSACRKLVRDLYNDFTFADIKYRGAPGYFIENALSFQCLTNNAILLGTGSQTGDARVFKISDPTIAGEWSVGDGNMTQVFSDANCEQILAIKQISDGSILIGAGYGTGDGKIFRSTDNGSSWTQITLPDQANIEGVYSIEDCGGGHVLAGVGYTPDGSADIMYSSDYGASFTKVDLDSDVAYIPTIKSLGGGKVLAGTGYLTGDAYVYKSNNYGAAGSWSRVLISSSLETVKCIDYAGNDVCYCGTGTDTGDGNIWKSWDAGSSWTKVSSLTSIGSILCLKNRPSGDFIFGTNLTELLTGNPYSRIHKGVISASPSITSITPNTGITNLDELTITGTDLKEYSVVLLIDDVDYSANITYNSTTSIIFTAPDLSYGNHSVKVTVAGTTSSPYTITYASPEITAITPDTDLIYGQDIAITGSLLQGDVTTVLKIDGNIYSTTSVSPTEVHFDAPNLQGGPHTVKMVLDGVDTNEIEINYPLPTITTITPDAGIMGGDTLTMAGKGLLGVAFNTLWINGEDYTANIVSETSTEIVFTAPALASGTYGVQVQVDDGWLSNEYEISYDFPAITDVQPSEGIIGVGQLVEISGTNLQGSTTTVITINGTDYSHLITSSSETQIYFTAPDLSVGTYSLIVTTDGNASAPYTITYTTQEESMLAQFLPMIKFHEYDLNGDPLAGGKVYTYTAGATPSPANYKTTYTTATKTTPNANPIVLDSSGRANIVLDSGAYKVVVTDADDVEIYTIDNVTDASALSGTILATVQDLKDASYANYRVAQTSGYYAYNDGGQSFYYFSAASTATANNGSVILPTGLTGADPGRWLLVSGNIVTARQFGAVGDGTTNDYTAISNAATYLNNMGGGVLIFGAGAYNFTSALTIPATVDVQFRPGAYLKSTNTSALTINKMSDRNLSKRFDSTLGTITLGSGVLTAYPQWFGAVGDGSTNDSAPIQKCIDSAYNVEFPYATYKVTTGITVGTGRKIDFKNSILSPNANSITVLTLNENTSLATKSFISNLNITNGASKTSVTGLAVTKSLGANLTNVHVTAVETGVSMSNASNVSATNISISSCTNSGLNLTSNLTGTGKMVSCVFNDVILDGNACGLYLNAGVTSVLQNIQFNGLHLKDNTVNGAFFEDVSGITLASCNISGNGSGAASVSVGGSTVYKSDIYLKNAKVILRDSVTESSLNESVQLASNSILTTDNYTGYASATNTHILCGAGSYVVERGLTDATGYISGLQTYGVINEITHPYICWGAGASKVIHQGGYGNMITNAQYPTVSVDAGATASHAKVGSLVRAIDFAASAGSTSANNFDIALATGMSSTYQISSILVLSTSNSNYMVKWSDNSASYQHEYTAPADRATWIRHVFITAGKTSHTIQIWPTDTAGGVMYVKDAMTYDGTLTEVSQIYNQQIVAYDKMGDFDSAAPTAGTWTDGDVVFNSDAASAGYIGWVCVTAGTPGTWDTWGYIN